MIVVDSSALVAILLREPEREMFIERVATGGVCLLSAGNHIETAIVIAQRRGPDALDDLDSFLDRAGIETVDVTVAQARLAREAWLRFGRGVHPAALNFGDCFAYALAKEADAPLLYKGDDFARTDIRPALRAR